MKVSKKRLRKFLSILVVVIVPLVILYFTGFKQSLGYILSVNPSHVLLAFILSNIPVLLHSYTWKRSLEIVDIEMSYKSILELNLSHLFVNNLTPIGYSGGEPTIAYFLSRRTEKSMGKILSAILAANFVNFIPIFTMSLLGLIFSSPARLTMLFLSILPSKERLREEFRELGKGFNLLKASWKSFISPIIVVHIGIISNILAIIVIGNGLNVALATLPLLLILPLTRFSAYFPTPGGSGVQEITLISLLMLFYDINVGQAAAITIISRTITFYFGIVIGYLAFSREGIRQIYLSGNT